MQINNRIKLLTDFVKYNLRIVFANKFVYFLIAAMAFFLLVITINLFSGSSNITVDDVYALLILPGLLIIFYPVVFNIQNDKDARMLEIIFGVPNYRYKVYLFRFVLSIFTMAAFLLFMSAFTVFAIIRIPIFEMVYQLMFPLLFLAGLAFLMATLIRNASGAAVVMVLFGLFFWILYEPLQFSKWNIFINPFDIPNNMSYGVFKNIIYQNRLMMVIATIISLLWAMLNLQKREKFV